MSALITEPGLYQISAAEYHADPCPEPSLSNSIIRELIWPAAPKRAWYAHPQLNPQHVDEDRSRRAELGSVAHELLLGAGRGLVIIDADSYRSKDAQADRDAAYAIGKTPVLTPMLEQARHMVAAAEEQLRAFEDTQLFYELATHETRCMSEIAAVWQERDGTWGRSLIDRLLRPVSEIWEVWDYKTTSRNVRPDGEGLGVHFTDNGYDTQAAMIERGLIAIHPDMAGRIKFRFLFQESFEPYLISVVEPDPATLEIGRKKVEEAFATWADCLRKNEWPGYPRRVVQLRHSEWLASRWIAHEIEAYDASLAPAAPKAKSLRGKDGPRLHVPVPLPPGETILDGG